MLKNLLIATALVLLCPMPVMAAPMTGKASAACVAGRPPKETIEACTKFLSLPDIAPPTRADALVIRGVAYSLVKEFDLARSDFETVQEIKYSPAISHVLGTLYINLGKSDEAVAEFTKLIDAGAATAEIYSLRGAAYQNAGKFDDSISDFDKALSLKPDFLEALNNRAAAYAKKGDLKAAVKDLDAVLAANPDMPIALVNRCGLLAREGHFDLGRHSCDKAEELSPGDYFMLFALGGAYYDAGQFESAIGYYNRSLQLAPNNAWALYARGIAEAKFGRGEESKADLMAAERIQPDIVAFMAKSGTK